MENRRRFVLVLCFAVALSSVGTVGTVGLDFCDDGITDVEKDLSEENNSRCAGDKLVKVEEQHTDKQECAGGILLERAVCMNETIVYTTIPPMGGTYRYLPPEYGEYSYLPPERWVHALGLGGVVFLYHPCAPPEVVAELRSLATSCLQQHILTPYPKLSKKEPYAIVVWGCVFRMAQVEVEAAKTWIRKQKPSAVSPPSTATRSYNHSLLVSAKVSEGLDSELCPDTRGENASTTYATTTSSPTGSAPELQGQLESEEDQVMLGHVDKNIETEEEIFSRKGIFVGLFVVFCVLFVAGIVVAVVLQRKFKWIKSSYKPRKYKFVGSFFLSKDTRTYIPPTGTPKVPGAEQSRLLDSDEEEV